MVSPLSLVLRRSHLSYSAQLLVSRAQTQHCSTEPWPVEAVKIWWVLEVVVKSLLVLEYTADELQVVFSVAGNVITEKYLEVFDVRWTVLGTY